REAQTDTSSRRRQYLRIDADQLVISAHKSTAGIPLVDRRVRLEKIFKAAVAQPSLPALGADDSHGNRLTNSERIANREHYIANACTVGIAQVQNRQSICFHFQHCQIARRIRTYNLSFQAAIVVQVDLNLICAVDHVMVSQNVTILSNDDA